MRIVFIGAVQFSLRTLQRLVELEAEVVGVVTLRESAFNADHVDLTPFCHQHGIPCMHAPDINADPVLDWVAALRPDVIFCFGWSRLIEPRLLALAPLGAVGFHPTALPANRGRHPLIWTLALGLEEAGSSFFFLGEGADDGDILSQERIRVDATDDAAALYEKVTERALRQIATFLPQLEAGSHARRPQDHRAANTWRKRGKADGQIDWRMSSVTIHNLVRALAKPYVGAHFVYRGQEVKVWRTEVVESAALNVEPGRVLEVQPSGPIVKCGMQAIRLVHTEPTVAPSPGDYL